MIRREEYPKELINLIIQYAKKGSQISQLELIESIKNFTPVYYLIGNYDWEFKEDSIYWQEFLQRYANGEDLVELVYDMYIKNYQEFSNFKWFGCFRYSFVEDEKGSTGFYYFVKNFILKKNVLPFFIEKISDLSLVFQM